jgi:hypothetical protein
MKKFIDWFLGEKTGLLRFAGLVVFLSVVYAIGQWREPDAHGGWKYLSLVLGVIIGIFLGAVLYLKDIYEIHDFWKVFWHLFAAIFPCWWLPFWMTSLKVSGGRREIADGEVNTLNRIGGPGRLIVEPGNVVILETLLAPARILGAGEHRIRKGEIIKDVIALEEYSGRIDKITASTQDGIDVKVTNVEFRFIINPATQTSASRTMQNPYPFSRKSVYDLVYNRTVSADGKTGDWMGAVQGVIKGIIAEHISAHDLDSLLSPAVRDAHPMFELRRKFSEPQNQEKIKGAGAKLLWVNIGNFAAESDDIEKQRLQVWLAKQSGVEKIMQAQGEAEKISSRERGRAEAQAVLLRSIAQALQEVDTGGKQDKAKTAKNLWNIVMARTAQILESMSVSHPPRDHAARDKKGTGS